MIEVASRAYISDYSFLVLLMISLVILCGSRLYG